MPFFFAVPIPLRTAADEPQTQFGAFFDGYYGYDFQAQPGRKRDYATQAIYSNVPSVNLALAELKQAGESFRFRVAGQAGDSVNANYSSEPRSWVRHIQESVAGIRVSDSTWIDAGIYASHIGPESWISRDNTTYTRSLISEFSPYYQSGARLSTKFCDTWSAELHFLNGWQNISENRHPALGTQIAWKARDDFSITQNMFFGGESNGERTFHDLIFSYSPSARLKIIQAIDLGYQTRGGQGDVWWWGAASILGYEHSPMLLSSLRFEQFSDPHGVVATTNSDSFFRARAVSAGVDLLPCAALKLRFETKYIFSGGAIFQSAEEPHSSEVITVLSLGVTL